MRLRFGTPQYLAVAAALKTLKVPYNGEFPTKMIGDKPAEEQELLFRNWLDADVVPLMARAMATSEDPLTGQIAHWCQAYVTIAEAALNALRQDVSILATRMQESKASVLVFKSLDLADNIWPSIAINATAAELLVQPPESGLFCSLLRELGYREATLNRSQGTLDETPNSSRDRDFGDIKIPTFRRLVRAKQLDHLAQELGFEYHLPHCLYIGTAAYLVLSIDAYFTVLAGVSIPQIWEHRRRIQVLNTLCSAQDPSDMVWSLAAVCYHDIMLDIQQPWHIRRFLDVLAVVYRFRTELEWDRIVAIAKQYGVGPPLYYVLTHVSALLGADETLRPDIERLTPTLPNTVRRRDWGDFLPRLFNAPSTLVALSLEQPFVGPQ